MEESITLDETFGDLGTKVINFQPGPGVNETWGGDGLVITPDGIFIAGQTPNPYLEEGLRHADFAIARYLVEIPPEINLTATAAPSGVVNLHWTNDDHAEDGFEVQRSRQAAGPFETLAYVNENVTDYTDSSVEPATTYHYRVRSFDGDNDERSKSNVASATTVPPNAPYVLLEKITVPINRTYGQSDNNLMQGVHYQIRAVGKFHLGQGSTGDAEYGWFNGVPFNKATDPVPDDADWGIMLKIGGTETHVSPGYYKSPYWGPPSTDHTYTITYQAEATGKLKVGYVDGLNWYGDNEYWQTPPPPSPFEIEIYTTLPAAPSHLTAVPGRPINPLRIDLKWRDNSSDEQGFVVERSSGGAPFVRIATLPPNTIEYFDIGGSLTQNTVYTYRVITRGPAGDSQPSVEASTILVPNQPPVIDPIGDRFARLGEEFTLLVRARDPEDGRVGLSYAIVSPAPGPEFVIDQETGFIHGWVPQTASQEYTVRGRVTDQDGLIAERDFILRTTEVQGTPPNITDVQGLLDEAGRIITLTATVAGGNVPGLTYVWEVVGRPDEEAPDPVFDPTNGTHDANMIDATFGPDGVVATYWFTVTVTDAEGDFASKTADVILPAKLTGLLLEPASVTLTPGDHETFLPKGIDQFGHTMSSLPGVQIDWALDNTTIGSIDNSGKITALEVTAGGTGTVTAQVQVQNISTTAQVVVLPGNAAPAVGIPNVQFIDQSHVRFSVVASDDGPESHLIYEWSQVNGNGLTFDTINGTNAAKTILATISGTGTLTAKVKVTDRGSPAEWTYSDNVTFSNQPAPTRIAISPSATSMTPGGAPRTHEFRATLVDQFGNPWTPPPTGFTWSFQGSHVGDIDSQTGVYTLPVGANLGVDVIQVSAVGYPGVPFATASVTILQQRGPIVSFDDENLSGNPPILTADTSIYGVIDDPNDDPVTWTLVAAPIAGGDAIQVAADSREIGSTTSSTDRITTISSTQLPDGVYMLKLTAKDPAPAGSNTTTSTERRIQIKTDLKLGNLTLPVTDLTIPNPGGLPITISRYYDSSEAGRDRKDFGFGWRFSSFDVDLRTTAWRKFGGKIAFAENDLVYITLPSGQQHVFRFKPIPFGPPNVFGLYWKYHPSFVSVDGGTSTLEVPGQETTVIVVQSGLFVGETNGIGYNPTYPQFGGKYTLITQDGTTYEIEARVQPGIRAGSLIKITDANDSTLTFGLNEIVSSTGMRVTIERNGPGGSISKVLAPDEQPSGLGITYTYTGSELASVLEPGASTPTTYSDEPETNRMNKVTDPRQLQIVSSEYAGSNGELKHLKDVYGNDAELTKLGFTGTEARQTVENLEGTKTELVYNHRGDVIREIKPVMKDDGDVDHYIVTIRHYLYGGPEAVANNDPNKSVYNVLFSMREWAPHVIAAPDYGNQRHRWVPGENDWIRYESYDWDGNRNIEESSRRDANGQVVTTKFEEYTPLGKPQSIIDEFGYKSRTGYDGDGNVLWTLNALGEGSYNEYDDDVRLVKTWRWYDDPAIPNLPPPPDPLSTPDTENQYFAATVPTVGAVEGMLEWTKDYTVGAKPPSGSRSGPLLEVMQGAAK